MNTKSTPQKTIDVRLSLGEEANIGSSNADGQRPFTGICNSGRPFLLWGERYVVDFDNLKHKSKVPVLLEHDRNRRAGVAEITVSMPDGLRADGVLLNNPHGKEIADDSDGSFPWEMSIDIRASREERVAADVVVTVNGITHQGPLRILRDCSLREVSFVTLGQDPNTSAVALSDSASDDKPKHKKEAEMPEGKDTQLSEAEVKLADQLKATQAKLAKSETDKALMQAGFAFADGKPVGISNATYQVLLSATDEQRTALLSDLKPVTESKPEVPNILLSDERKAETETKVQLAAATGESQFLKGQKYV